MGVEAGYDYETGALHRYAYDNQINGNYDLNSDVPPLTFAERFSLADELLEFVRLHKIETIAELVEVYLDKDISVFNKYKLWIGLLSDDDGASYFIEYNLMINEYKLSVYSDNQ